MMTKKGKYEEMRSTSANLAYALRDYSRNPNITETDKLGLLRSLDKAAKQAHAMDLEHEKELLEVSRAISHASPIQVPRLCTNYLQRFVEQTDRITAPYREPRRIPALKNLFG